MLLSDRLVRRLAAVLIADVVGYSRLMDQDEEGTHRRLRTLQTEVFEPSIARHGGKVVRLVGDGMLVVFSSAIEALRCAVETQHDLFERGRSDPAGERICLRVGINVADILIDEKDIAGGGVNVAARLEALAEPGGICVSQALKEQINEDIGVEYVDAGLRRVKNISRPVRVFRVVRDGLPTLDQARLGFERLSASATCPWAIAGALTCMVAVLATLLWTRSPGPGPWTAPAVALRPAPALPAHRTTITMTEGVRIELLISAAPEPDSAGPEAHRIAVEKALGPLVQSPEPWVVSERSTARPGLLFTGDSRAPTLLITIENASKPSRVAESEWRGTFVSHLPETHEGGSRAQAKPGAVAFARVGW